MSARVQRYVLAISREPEDASTTLFFGHLTERLAGGLRVARYGQPGFAAEVAGCSAIILVRGLFEMDSVVWAARVLNLPLYYFVDDNFMRLRGQPGPWSTFVEHYSAVNVRTRLRVFAGVLLSSSALIDYFKDEQLHHRLMLFPPVESARVLPRSRESRGAAGVGFFGGAHLHDTFRQWVLPAIRRLAAEQPISLRVAGVSETIAASPGLTIAHQEYDGSYARGLEKFAAAGVDVLVHPSVAGLANNAYKNPHALISARAIGAVPIVSDRPPYDDLRSAGVALLCDDSIESWYAALVQALGPVERGLLGERLVSFCSSQFGGSVNRQVIDETGGPHSSSSRPWALPRRAVVRASVLIDRLRRGVTLPRPRTRTLGQ